MNYLKNLRKLPVIRNVFNLLMKGKSETQDAFDMYNLHVFFKCYEYHHKLKNKEYSKKISSEEVFKIEESLKLHNYFNRNSLSRRRRTKSSLEGG